MSSLKRAATIIGSTEKQSYLNDVLTRLTKQWPSGIEQLPVEVAASSITENVMSRRIERC